MPFVYEVRCTNPGCDRPAVYKIAARWSDDLTEELKTYALVCEECLPRVYPQCLDRSRRCKTAAFETLETPGIYRLDRGRKDSELERLEELEARLAATQ